MKHLILGYGEIGKAIYKVLLDGFKEVEYYDSKLQNKLNYKSYNIIHVCFPYSKYFLKTVNLYKARFNCKHVIIHSTVPVGTSKKLKSISSPCRGVHPHLYKGIKTFVKYIGSSDIELLRLAKHIFKKCGVKTKSVNSSDSVEALKIWDTTQYGLNLAIQKYIHKWCEDNNLDFNIIYTHANKTYNKGYLDLKMPKYQKYILKNVPGDIGGHCIIPNLTLLNNKKISNIIKKGL